MKRKPCGKVSLEEGIERMREDVMALHMIGRSVAHISAVFRLPKPMVRDAIKVKQEEAADLVARYDKHPLARATRRILDKMCDDIEPPSADIVKMADHNWIEIGQRVLG